MLKLDVLVVFLRRHVLKDWFVLDDLEFGLEVLGSERVTGRVAAATRIGLVVSYVFNLLSGVSPVSLPTTLLLDLLGISVNEASLCKELWDMNSRTILVGVVAVSELVATGHVE